MKKNYYSGKFIVIEGLDGSGQSTQVAILKKYLTKKGFDVITTKEPTPNSPVGKIIRKVLDKKKKVSPPKLQRIFCQDREHHLNNLVIPALKQGKIVISDRYFFSTFAYGMLDLKLDWLIKLNDEFLVPGLTFLLKVKPRTCIQRIDKRGTGRTFFEVEAKLKKVLDNYETSVKRFNNVHIINGQPAIKKVSEDIIKIVDKKIMNIAKLIDHTNISLKAKPKDIIKTCAEAKKYDFRGVCVNPKYAKLVAKELKGTGIETIILIDPPMGLSSHQERLRVCKKAKEDGADELDIVMNIIDLKYEKYDNVLKDLKEVCRILPTKVIIGSGFLTDDEVRIASEIVKKAGAICVKTATFKDPLENRELKEKAQHLKTMRKAAPGLLIKASGNIKTLSDLKEMVRAGADIIGTSSGVKMMKQAKK